MRQKYSLYKNNLEKSLNKQTTATYNEQQKQNLGMGKIWLPELPAMIVKMSSYQQKITRHY